MNFQNIRADFANQCMQKETELTEGDREKLLEIELAMQYTRQSLSTEVESKYGLFNLFSFFLVFFSFDCSFFVIHLPISLVSLQGV